MKIYFTTITILCFTIIVQAQTPELIKDIRPGSFQDGVPEFLEQAYAKYNGKVYFTANDGATGNELWVTDGTEAGTILIKDINEGTEGSDPQKFYAAGDYLFFVATDEEHGRELWRTDGTEAGTILILDINPGTPNGAWQDSGLPNDYIDWNGILYFAASDGVNGIELWRSDGTEAGTFLVKDMNPGGGSSNARFFAVNGDKLYCNGAGSLWATDGTEAGTEIIKLNLSPEYTVSCNGFVFFVAAGTLTNSELCRSDGTEAGTVQVAEINPNSPNGASILCGSPKDTKLVCMEDIAYFIATDGTGKELWRSDGTDMGTYKVKEASSAEFNDCSKGFAVLNGVLYYSFDDGEHGLELWRSDGTEDGTYMVKDLIEGNLGSCGWVGSEHMIVTEDKLVFSAGYDFPLDRQLWVSDGTEAGTTFIGGLGPSDDPNPQNFVVLDDHVIFIADADFKGFEPWKLSLTPSNDQEVSVPRYRITLSPSITNGQFKIVVDGATSGVFHVELISLTGITAKHWEGVLSGEMLDVTETANGTYFVRVSNDEGFSTERLIITN